MPENQIKFIAVKEYLDVCDEFPVPIKVNIPEWFKKLKHASNFYTVKGCMPFLDTLTTGYLLKLPQDFRILHNVETKDPDGVPFPNSIMRCPINKNVQGMGVNLNHIERDQPNHDIHSTVQLEGSPLVDKNKNLPFYKILNPWKIVTPPGYSCLFVPPLNNHDDRFEIISGIVDTDVFENEINFPIVLNGDKYPKLDTTLKKGTPYVQIIPFKRENWKLKIEERTAKYSLISKMLYPLKLVYMYKEKFWRKKSFK